MKKILLLLLALLSLSLIALSEENDGFTVAADNGQLRLLFNEETLEIMAFMEAAEMSAKRGGAPVTIAEAMAAARQ